MMGDAEGHWQTEAKEEPRGRRYGKASRGNPQPRQAKGNCQERYSRQMGEETLTPIASLVMLLGSVPVKENIGLTLILLAFPEQQ